AERALGAARRSGDLRTQRETMFWLSGAELFGPMPIDQALAKCEQVLPDPQERVTIAHKLHWRGGLNAFAGRAAGLREIEEARASIDLARRSDSVMQLADVALALAMVLERMGRIDEAVPEALRAADLYARKGMEASAKRAHALLASLQ